MYKKIWVREKVQLIYLRKFHDAQENLKLSIKELNSAKEKYIEKEKFCRSSEIKNIPIMIKNLI